MSSGYNLEKGDHFRINAEVWLRTLLAITGDKEKKEEVVQTVAQIDDLGISRILFCFGPSQFSNPNH